MTEARTSRLLNGFALENKKKKLTGMVDQYYIHNGSIPMIRDIRKIVALLFLFCPALVWAEDTEKTELRVPEQFPRCPANDLTGGIMASDGTIWVISEAGAVYKLAPESAYSDSWFHTGYYAGYPDTKNFHGIAEDREGRIWVGTDNKGVSVFNGTYWETYDRDDALLGERVFDIAVSPSTGEVAVATSGGVCIYCPNSKTWRDISRIDGLVADQVESLCFGANGELWLAYACGGISQGNRKTDYKEWKTVQAPWYWDKSQRIRQPLTPRGNGLPSNLCNAVFAGNRGNVWLGTNSGLAFCDESNTWKFIRGEDYEQKNDGLFVDRKMKTSVPKRGLLLPEDYITCLRETDEGLWIGFRRKGAVLLDVDKFKIIKHVKTLEDPAVRCGWVSDIIPLPDGSVYATTFGGGLAKLQEGKRKFLISKRHQDTNPPHPERPSPLTEEELNSWTARFQENKDKTPPPVIYWKEDWSTRGDWCERYGRDLAMLCAMNAPIENDLCFEHYRKSKGEMHVSGQLGPHSQKDDSLRHWVHWVYQPHNRNVLYTPRAAIRTEAEWDDHGEAYPHTFDGPDVWVIVQVPEGGGNVSLYFYNPNGYEPDMDKRDYLIEVRKSPSVSDFELFSGYGLKGVKSKKNHDYNEKLQKRKQALAGILKLPVLARSRVRFFAGSGVYKTFYVQEGGYYYVRVCRNYSLNTIVNGVFLTANKENEKRMYFPYDKIDLIPDHKEKEIFDRVKLFNKENSYSITGKRMAELYAYRSYRDSDADNLDYWRWKLNIVNDADRKKFDIVMLNAWKKSQSFNPFLRSSEFSKYSPNTISFSIDEVEAMDALGIDWEQYLPGRGSPKISVPELKKKLTEYIKNEKKQFN